MLEREVWQEEQGPGQGWSRLVQGGRLARDSGSMGGCKLGPVQESGDTNCPKNYSSSNWGGIY